MSLHDISYEDGTLAFPSRRRTADDSELRTYLAEARRVVEEVAAAPGHGCAEGPEVHTEDFEALRWFPLPEEVGGRPA